MPQIIEIPGMGHVEFPDGMSDDDIAAAIKKNSPQASAPEQPQASAFDKALGSAYGRMQLGVVNPLLGIGQAGAHAIDAVAGTDYGKRVDDTIQKIEASKKRGMAAHGHDPDSTDWMGMLGFAGPGAAISKGVGTVLPAATGPLGRAFASGVQGATVGAASPTKGEDFASEKAGQVLTGGTLGGLSSLGLDAAKAIGRPIGKIANFFTGEGHKAIGDDIIRAEVGPDNVKRLADAALAAKTRLPAMNPAPGAQGPTVPASPMTAAEATQGLPEASPLQALQDYILKRTGGPSKLGGELKRNALAAQNVAKAQVEAELGPVREEILGQANLAGKALPGLEKSIAKAEKGASRLGKELGRFAPKMAEPPPDALRSAVDIHGYHMPPVPLRSATEMARMELLPELIAKRQGEIRSAMQAIDEFKSAGLAPLKVDTILRDINKMNMEPGDRASTIVQRTLEWAKTKLHDVRDKHGIVDAKDLYMVRREAGDIINKFAAEEKTFDKRLTAGLLNHIQDKIDDAIEGAGGVGWRERYMRPYADKLQRVAADVDSKEAMYQPLQKTSLTRGGLTANADIPFGGGPSFLNRYWNALRWLPRARAQSIEGKVEQHLADTLADSQRFGQRFSEPMQPSKYEKLIDALMRRAPVSAGVAGGQVGR